MTTLRMKDLVERTGASREAIRFYINEGLLPEPRRTSRNMAWYSEEHVERVRYIRALQNEHYLPLKAIRDILDGRGGGQFTPHQLHQFEVLRTRLRAQSQGQGERPLGELIRDLGMTDDEVALLRQLGLVGAGDLVEAAGVEMAQLWMQMRADGLTPERGFGPADFHIIDDAVELLLGQELRLFTQRLGGLDDAELERLLTGVLPAVNSMFSILHQQRLREFLVQATQGGGDTDND